MEDRLEKFIQENREGFDDAVPNLKVWAQIDKELSQPKVQKTTRPAFAIRRWASIAAAGLLLLTVGTLFGIQITKSQYGAFTEVSALMDEFGEMESFYQNEITKKVSLLEDYKMEKAVESDLNQLESFLSDLKTELDQAPEESKESIVNAMITNYKTRLDILERILNKLEATKQKDKKDDQIEI